MSASVKKQFIERQRRCEALLGYYLEVQSKENGNLDLLGVRFRGDFEYTEDNYLNINLDNLMTVVDIGDSFYRQITETINLENSGYLSGANVAQKVVPKIYATITELWDGTGSKHCLIDFYKLTCDVLDRLCKGSETLSDTEEWFSSQGQDSLEKYLVVVK